MKTSRNSKPRPSRTRRWVFGALALAAAAGVTTIALTTLTQPVASAEPAIPAGANFTSWADNGKSGERLLQLVRGDMSAVGARVSGVVKTDTNCDPDAEGINHCRNLIGLANGGEIEVIHNHMMMTYECLAPGQKLTLARLDAGWIIAKDAR